MSWVLDIFVLLIIGLIMFQCARRGFVRTVIELIGYVVSLILAFTLSSALSSFVYKAFLRGPIIETVEKQLVGAAAGNAQNAVSGIFENLPGVVTGAADGFGITQQSVAGQIEANISGGAEQAAPLIADFIAEKILISLLSMIFLSVLFIVFMILVRFIANIVNKAVSVPVLGKANKLLGAGIGLIKGLIIVFVIASLIGLILPMTKNGIWFITRDAVDNSILFRALSNFNPLG